MKKTIEELLETEYWIIDILPGQVPECSPGQFFEVEKYYLSKERLEEIKRNPGYKEAEVRRFDVRFVNGRSVGAVNPQGEVVKRWKRKARQ